MAVASATWSGIRNISRMWMLSEFCKALAKREREVDLLDRLNDCILKLWRDPDKTGLNLEYVATAGSHVVLSARISQSDRLILVEMARNEVGLLHFNNHDEAYKWVDRHLATIPTMLSRIDEVPRGDGLLGQQRQPIPRAHEDCPIPLNQPDELGDMLKKGILPYLTYLDDEQRLLAGLRVSENYLIKGGAGTGKTAVALHRVMSLLRQPDLMGPNRVLYLCFNRVLVNTIRQMAASLTDGSIPPELEIDTIDAWCRHYLENTGLTVQIDPPVPADASLPDTLIRISDGECRHELAPIHAGLRSSAGEVSRAMSIVDLQDEILEVIRANHLKSVEEYQAFNRGGRPLRLKQTDRAAIWQAHEALWQRQLQRRVFFWQDLAGLTLDRIRSGSTPPEYRAVVVDEGQDFSPARLELALRVAEHAGGKLTVLADPAQDIYGVGFDWAQRKLGKKTWYTRRLRRCYRNTSEIDRLALSLMSGSDDYTETVDDSERPTRHGPRPTLIVSSDPDDEARAVCDRIASDVQSTPPEQIAVLSPTKAFRDRVGAELARRSVSHRTIEGVTRTNLNDPTAKLITIASGKGLDFPVVYVVGLHQAAFPMRSGAAGAQARRSLYVGLTRASLRLTLSTVYENHHPLLQRLDPDLYDVAGSRGAEFANLYAGVTPAERAPSSARARPIAVAHEHSGDLLDFQDHWDWPER